MQPCTPITVYQTAPLYSIIVIRRGVYDTILRQKRNFKHEIYLCIYLYIHYIYILHIYVYIYIYIIYLCIFNSTVSPSRYFGMNRQGFIAARLTLPEYADGKKRVNSSVRKYRIIVASTSRSSVQFGFT